MFLKYYVNLCFRMHYQDLIHKSYIICQATALEALNIVNSQISLESAILAMVYL